MIVVKLKGGLGNQMFQYAFGRSLAIKHNTGLFLDLSYLKDRTRKAFFQFRDYELDFFNVVSEVLENCNEENLKIQKEHHFHFDHKALDYPDNSYLDGYWQSEKYFKEYENEIRNDFTFKNQLPKDAKVLEEKILNTNSVCIHIRHGFTNNIKDRIYHGFTGRNYVNKSIRLIKKSIANPVFFIFSDNQEWCQRNIKTDCPTYFIENEVMLENVEYFQLMTFCKHFVIANSSFSWWGAWLSNNPNKIVIAPKRWFRLSFNRTKDLLPENWIKI